MANVIYAANTSSQATLVAGTTVDFGSVVRKSGCVLNISGGDIVISGAGYYDVDVNLTVVPTAAGTLVVQLYNDGVAVPGAEAIVSVAADTTYAVTIPAVVRESCSCEKTLTVTTSGAVGAITNAAITVEKI